MQNTDEPGSTAPASELVQQHEPGATQPPTAGTPEPPAAAIPADPPPEPARPVEASPTPAAPTAPVAPTTPGAPTTPAESAPTAAYPYATYPTPPTSSQPAQMQQPTGVYAGASPQGGYAASGTGYADATGYPGAWTSDPSSGYSGYPTAGSLPGAAGANQAYGQPAYPPRRRLTRSQDDRVVSGVLGGLARYWNTDPLLLRILTVVLTIATGGALLLGYLIAWIAIPLEPGSPNGWPGGAGYAAGGNPGYGAPGGPPAPTAPFEEAPPRPPRSYLGWLVVSLGLIVTGVLAVFGILAEPTSGFAAFICAAVLIVLGAGLVVGAWYGRARWLTVLAVPMVFITMAAVATSSWVQSPEAERFIASPDGGISVGDRSWTVTRDDISEQPLEYRLSAGEATLDLRQLTAGDGAEDGRPGQRVTINASVGLGQLMVVIPEDMQVNLAATVKAGAVAVPAVRADQGVIERSGTDLDVNQTIESVTDGQPAYVVDLDVAIGAGNVEVRRAAS